MVMMDNRTFFKLDEGEGKLHFKHTLETLARINTVTYTLSFERLLRYVQLHEELSTHVIFTGIADTSISADLSILKTKGANVFQLNEYGITPFKADSSEGGRT